jgi:putative (di)nucleoside polyphosphate hydrolase
MTPEQIAALPYRKNVGIMLLNAENQAFVGKRLDYQSQAWQMPQGGIDDGEDPTTAALRELQEETGIDPKLVTIERITDDWIAYDLPADVIGKFWSGKYRGQEQKWFRLRFHGTDTAVNIDTEHPEFSEWKWMDLDQLIDNIIPFKREVYEHVLAALANDIR